MKQGLASGKASQSLNLRLQVKTLAKPVALYVLL
jgi:hypothetical protein